jgi:hypothetical protein
MPVRFKVRFEDGREFGPAAMDVLVHWAREGRISTTAALIPVPDEVTANLPNPIPVLSEPRLAAILNAPPTIGGALPAALSQPGDEAVATVVPYRNKPALIGYYLAIFGCLFAILIPVLGFVMPIAAIILGTRGLKAVKADPKVHGTAHAVIALAGGILGTLLAIGNFAVFLLILSKK